MVIRIFGQSIQIIVVAFKLTSPQIQTYQIFNGTSKKKFLTELIYVYEINFIMRDISISYQNLCFVKYYNIGIVMCSVFRYIPALHIVHHAIYIVIIVNVWMELNYHL